MVPYPNNSSHLQTPSGAMLEDWENSIGLQRAPPPPEKTTMMLRNLPQSAEQKSLLEHLHEGAYTSNMIDFFYLPIDFRSRKNVGYCFVNFRNPADARRFASPPPVGFNGKSLPGHAPGKSCEVMFARIQGYSANVEQYRNSPVIGIPIQSYRPLIFDEKGHEKSWVANYPPDHPVPPVQLREPRRLSPPTKEPAKMHEHGMDHDLVSSNQQLHHFLTAPIHKQYNRENTMYNTPMYNSTMTGGRHIMAPGHHKATDNTTTTRPAGTKPYSADSNDSKFKPWSPVSDASTCADSPNTYAPYHQQHAAYYAHPGYYTNSAYHHAAASPYFYNQHYYHQHMMHMHQHQGYTHETKDV